MEVEIEFSREEGGRSIVKVSGDCRRVEVEERSPGIVVRIDTTERPDFPEIDPENCNCSRQAPCERLLRVFAILEIAYGVVGLAKFLLEVVPLILGML